MRSHLPTRETGGPRPPWPEENGLLELDDVLCHHRTPHHSAQGPGRVLDSGTFRLPPNGESKGVEAERPEGRWGPDRERSGGPGLRCTSIAKGGKDGGMDYSAAVNGKWDRTGCAGMARFLLPAIWPRSLKPTILLWWMQHQFIHFYSLNYKQVGLVTARHNSIHDGVADLDRKSFTPTHVLDEPFIFAGCAGKRPKTNPVRYKATSSTPLLEATEQKDDLLIYNLFQNGTGSVNSMCIMNINAEFNLAKTPETFHQVAEWTKKKMFLEACLHQCQQFLPFITSVGELLCVEASDTLKG